VISYLLQRAIASDSLHVHLLSDTSEGLQKWLPNWLPAIVSVAVVLISGWQMRVREGIAAQQVIVRLLAAIALTATPTPAGAQAQVESAYDRFRDSTTLNVSAHFPRLRYDGKVLPDSLSLTLGIVFKGKPSKAKKYRPYIALALMRTTQSGVGVIDSTDALVFLVDGSKRFTAPLRTYSGQDFGVIARYSEIVAYRLKEDDFETLRKGKTVEVRIGMSEEVPNTSVLAEMARALVAYIRQ
jgi:hypothetical protein